jgi:hypothetical protein
VYNRVDSFLSETQRVRRNNRLRLTSVQTGNSIEAILAGNVHTILGLAFLIHLISKERRVYWETEKAKWDAKSAERKFQQGANQEAGKRIRAGLLKLDVVQHVPIHGHVGTNEEFVKIVGTAP